MSGLWTAYECKWNKNGWCNKYECNGKKRTEICNKYKDDNNEFTIEELERLTYWYYICDNECQASEYDENLNDKIKNMIKKLKEEK